MINELEDLDDPLYSSVKKQTFVDIDRKQKDKDIVDYQKIEDGILFDKIYREVMIETKK